jgi:hypothetical protein
MPEGPEGPEGPEVAWPEVAVPWPTLLALPIWLAVTIFAPDGMRTATLWLSDGLSARPNTAGTAAIVSPTAMIISRFISGSSHGLHASTGPSICWTIGRPSAEP